MLGKYTRFIGLLCLMTGGVTAEETNTVVAAETSATKEFTGGEIVVTAERMRPVELAGTTRSMDASDLEQRGSGNLAEALRTMPGIYTRTSNDGRERIDIRGFRTRHINLLLNGVPMNSTYDGQFDPGLIPVENIARIKVGYGNQSILYGSGGLGGVINVITKAGEPGFHGSGEVQVGEGERYIARGTLSESTDKVDLFVGASHAEQAYYNLSDDFEPEPNKDGDIVEDGGKRENSDYERNNILGSATVHFDDDWALGLVANYMSGQFGKPQNTSEKKPDYERVDDYDGYGAQVTLNRNALDSVSIRTALFYNELNELLNTYSDGTYTTIDDTQDDKIRSYGINLQAGRSFWKGFNATAAAGLKQDDYQNNTDPELSLVNGMIGVEAEQKLVENWVILGGYTQNWQQNDASKTETVGSWLLGTTYDLFEPTMLHASYAHQIRFASIKQLYDPKKGNANLTPESSDNYEAGITQDLGERSHFDITAFVRDVDDYIEKDEATKKYDNFEQYLFYGFEATVDSQVTDTLNGYASYTYMETENKSTSYSLQYRPKHIAQLGAEWTVFKHLLLFGKIRYVADQYADTEEMEKADDYVLVDLRATWAAWDALRLYVGVDNVFDKNYAQSVGVPREGSTFYVGAKAIF